MTAGQVETELKFEIEPDQVQQFLDIPMLRQMPSTCQELVSIYYDTPSLALRQNGFSLRSRRQDGDWLQTVKAPNGSVGGLFSRMEWERPIDSAFPSLFPDPGALIARRGHHLHARLTEVFTSKVRRQSWMIDLGSTRLELALDRGELKTGSASEPVCEIELELKSGSTAVLVEFARLIEQFVTMRPSPLSKAERGYRLASGKAMRPAAAPAIRLDAAMSAKAAFTSVADSCLRHLAMNEPLVRAKGGPRAVQQTRIALRRLRVNLWLFRHLFEDDLEFEPLRSELRWLHHSLGGLRDLDVLRARLVSDDKARLKGHRALALAEIQALLRSDRVRRLFFSLSRWLSQGDWRQFPEPLEPDEPTDLASFVAQRLDRLHRRIIQKGQNLARLDPVALHGWRIEVKKLRYAALFVAGVFPDPVDAAAFIGRLKAMQTALGNVTDLDATADLYRQFGLEAPKGDTSAMIRAVGIGKIAQAYADLSATEPFWRAGPADLVSPD